MFIYMKELMHDMKKDIYAKIFRKLLEKEYHQNHEIFKWYSYTQLMIKWNQLRKSGISCVEYLIREGYRDISIYGCGDIGKLYCDELLDNPNIRVIEFIDRMDKDSYKNIPVVKLESMKKETEAVIVTPIADYLDIAVNLYLKTDAKLISLEDIVSVLFEKYCTDVG